MGLGDFVRRRHDRESALNPEALAGLHVPASGDEVHVGTQSPGPAQVIDLRGQAGVREAVLNALRQNGIDPSNPNPAQVNAPAAQQAILGALSQHGVDLAAIAGGMSAGVHVPPAAGSASAGSGEGQRIGELERLLRLKDQGALTEAEFDRQKRKLLG